MTCNFNKHNVRVYHWVMRDITHDMVQKDENGYFVEYYQTEFFWLIESLSSKFDVMIKRDKDKNLMIFLDDLGRSFKQR
jgi:hypothetical protein